MYAPTRGGTRGGAGEFSWSDVKADKDREHYLGHSINAPAGRWQNNKDVHWYNREQKQSEDSRQAEIRKIKEAEEDALAVALGFKPKDRSIPEPDPVEEDIAAKLAKIERKAEKKALKHLKAEAKAERKALKHGSRRSKSPGGSPFRDSHETHRSGRDYHSRDRSKSPERRRIQGGAESSSMRHGSERESGRFYDGRGERSSHDRNRERSPYDPAKERDRQRAQWDKTHNSREEGPSRRNEGGSGRW